MAAQTQPNSRERNAGDFTWHLHAVRKDEENVGDEAGCTEEKHEPCPMAWLPDRAVVLATLDIHADAGTRGRRSPVEGA
jgi:hypothetical protein